ncbi:MAG: helix-turn-helix domain-containing protein [Acidimicrobiales bacterium]
MSDVVSFEVRGADRKRLAAAVGAPDDGAPMAIRTAGGEIELPPAARAAVRQLLEDLAAGTPVHLVSDDGELTTQQAGELLGISRTYVVRLVDAGKLPGHRVGTHRRLRVADVLAYKAKRDHALAGAAAVAEADVAAGVPYH